uniref:ATP synthase complex subunit 8 n=1 Tax=Tuxedo cruralis TaxID=1336461 RepID=A0A514LPT1_9HEMI|nr:ATP synthase F0 subunit 8 [Tuxedo cruralis]QDI93794.1 ATP synthase F0 subunit 8 [Tuxedo cruralis]QDI93819.1 ATP synthase F0 subunit 8 [Tuxedo cruralis]QDI93832.1 ATP synthase F0 subunit 8 [Tuxedo cruralis]
MPQMSPMWWTTLFLVFLATYMLVMVIMYTYNIYQIMNNSSKKNNNIKNINWKW